jgi:hypothetical protein
VDGTSGAQGVAGNDGATGATGETGPGVCTLEGGNTTFGQGAFGSSGCTAPTGTLDNTAVGFNALANNTEGSSNTAAGNQALNSITTGNNNIALGTAAGSALTNENDNIDIGHAGVATDAGVIRIGDAQTATFIAGISGVAITGGNFVVIDANGQLGTGAPAFGQINQDIQAMDTAIAQQRDEFKALVAEQRKSIELLTARVKAQDDQLQRVTVRMEQNRVTPKTVANKK